MIIILQKYVFLKMDILKIDGDSKDYVPNYEFEVEFGLVLKMSYRRDTVLTWLVQGLMISDILIWMQ